MPCWKASVMPTPESQITGTSVIYGCLVAENLARWGILRCQKRRAGLNCETRSAQRSNRELEPDDSFEHEPAELASMANMVDGIAREFLLHVFHLRHEHWREEHARAELPAVRADVASDSRELSGDLVVPRGDEELVARTYAIDGVERILPD